MNKTFSAAVAGLTAMASVLTAVPATAQSRWRDSDRDGRPDAREWNRDRDRDGRPDQWDRRDNRNHRWSYYGGSYGYNGYRGRWRTGQRFPYYNNNRYVITDYRAYNLPPPRRGYRYYRDDSGDIVMAAIGSGIIGLILGSQLR
jgi:Ni/Co efflux regulator RcnB